MSRVDGLVRAYERRVLTESQDWERGLAGAQRVWFAVYDPRDERRVRRRVGEFELATGKAGRDWALHDLSGAFGRWMGAQEYRDAYFESPDDLAMAAGDFHEHVAAEVGAALDAAGDNAVVALLGVGALFGLMRVSRLMELVAPRARGRLLVFFPGEHDGNNYRLLDARDGWNYLAVAIKA